jgi:hypothetical protein
LGEGAVGFDHMLEECGQLGHGCFYPRALLVVQAPMQRRARVDGKGLNEGTDVNEGHG